MTDASDTAFHRGQGTSGATTAWARVRRDLADMVHEQGEYAELMYALVRRDLSLRYQNSLMGFGWAIFAPLLQMLIFTLVFTRVVPLDTGVPYPLFAYVGLWSWNLFASSLRFAGSSLTANPNLVTKVYFPREVLPFSAVAVSLFDFMVASTVLAGLMWYYGVAVGWSVAFIPVIVLVQLAFTAGVALLVSMAHLFYTDVKHIFELVLTVWMFATAVLYPVDRIGGMVGRLLQLNPMTPIVDAYRSVLLRGTLPEATPFATAAAIALVVFVTSWMLFHRAEFRFAEEI
jgi:ABC-type polysaccharide/polyol phosphate export permease